MNRPLLRHLEDNLYLARGPEQILALAPMLEQLARRTGQLGAMSWLEYFLNAPSRVAKPPYLVLRLSVHDPAELHPQHIRAAALFFEYRVAGIRSRVFSTDDAVGYRTVIAAPRERSRFAQAAATSLLQVGAHIVLTNYESESEEAPAETRAKVLSACSLRRVPRVLPLEPTFDGTLAQFGQSTRFNLRYYRRRLERRTQLEYVTDARAHLSLPEFERLNSVSLNPVDSAAEMKLRWKCAHLPESFLVGLRSAHGEWLSLVGGWRQDTMTVLHWQMNASGHEQDSIGTVMRSFLLEHEIAGGARELLIYGGTPHTINHAFTQDTIADLMLCRDSLRTRAMRRVAKLLTARSGALQSNHLLRTLTELELQAAPQPQPLVGRTAVRNTVRPSTASS